MQNITTTSSLKIAIQQLEVEHAFNEQLLKEQFYIVYESLKPLNILKNTFKDITSSPLLIDNVLGTATGMATGFITKKIIVRGSGNLFRKLIGSALQLGVTNLVAGHPEAVKSIGRLLYQYFLHKKEKKRILKSNDN
jgi:hypothetical protein